MPEHQLATANGQVSPIQKQYVAVHVVVQRRAEALHQRHRVRRSTGTREAGLAQQMD